MSKYKSKVDKIHNLSDDEIIKLHFDLQEEIKKQYKNREKKDCLDKAIELCDMAISISGLVMRSMKNKHERECDEYHTIFGKPSPASDFYYPSHYAFNQMCVILRKNGNQQRLDEITRKISAEGWGSGSNKQ
ncbi:hypothetical protein P2E05_15565 [Providencia stuartii]|uniref:hypothetical protein n=1 Tax=Providencia stuartii TaxID=588 RepID=UPI0023E1873C|nr:hypothetical protein [Providencia stuartii]ELR5142473.1 hypothetical protein [Providencia stuartii]WER21481.1 hypothetical protein P2E04_15560 [Providencia stuartii]WER25601.1 hypothetical protein P2E05_15565 [Providencia stuartii]WER29691.1 hypothetical protein P2E06_15565 [Providencia stuartii]